VKRLHLYVGAALLVGLLLFIAIHVGSAADHKAKADARAKCRAEVNQLYDPVLYSKADYAAALSTCK